MEDLVKYLDLPPDQKEISLLDAIGLNSINSTSVPSSLSAVPMYMLRRIMFFDNSFRVLPRIAKNNSNVSNRNRLHAFLDEDDEDGLVHPMDVFLYIFLKSHPILRQTLVNNVSKCQLSLPLITYDSSSEMVSFNPFAFQTLILSRSLDDKNARNFSAVEEPLPIISFVRVSDCQLSQKSELLNRILNFKHEYFFHKNCKGNIKRRSLLNGTVEIAWYLAKSKKNSIIKKHFIMLNLRGNACNYPIQREFLSKISSLLYVFVPLSNLTLDTSKILEDLHDKFKSKIKFLIYKGNPINESTMLDLIPNILSDENTIPLKMKNIHSDCDAIANSISNELDKIPTNSRSIMDCIETATSIGISCDILLECISSIQHIVEGICEDFPPLKPVGNDSCMILATLKKQLLPLQGEFGKWAEANRELQHIKSDIRGEFEVCTTKLKEAQVDARKIQTSKLCPPSGILNGLLKECPRIESDRCGFYLFWNLLKNHLDAISRNYLPFLYIEYKKWLVESNSILPNAEDVKERESRQFTAKSNLRKTAESLTESSIGIEHMLRELGQTFEAYSSSDANKKASLNQHIAYSPKLLPGIMASLILIGQAFEIVNGDDNHVPVRWVSEVLLSLSELIGADKKIFVLSVLGVQSSGKSTLLNTMFSISFPVSSGRCTRGVYMQLIPVIDSAIREELGYDYLMVLDTEGLRAPELSGNISYKRDNEMATFIVGLGDVTVINIRGESHVEVQDILQITVIAFIRMRQTYTKPKCFFVHQNVGDSQAHENLMLARTSLIDTLNEMTRCAAQQENKEVQFCQFGDVIQFDPEKDVFYFPGLFEGDPPMTSISSGYIEKAEELRSKIISCCSNEDRSFLTVKEWKSKLKNLWNSVMRENFVFSYKNILELNCRIELDTALSAWYSHFAQEMTARKSEYFNVLYNVDSEKLQNTLHTILQDFLENSKSIALELQQSIIDRFFVHHEKKNIFEQWNSQTERYFEDHRKKETKSLREDCNLIFKVEKQKQKIDVEFGSYQKEIVKIVRNLFEKYRDQGSFESVESEHFETIWLEWQSQIHFPKIDYADVPRDLQQVLLENSHLKQLDVISEKTILIKEIDKFKEFGTSEFEEMTTVFENAKSDCSYYNLIDRRTNKIFYGIFRVLKRFNPFKKDSPDAKHDLRMETIIQDFNNKVSSIFEEFFPKNSNYSIDFFHVLIDKSVTFISEYNKSERGNARESFILTNDFIFDFVFYQCCKAIKSFELLQEKFLEKNNLQFKLDQLKSTLFERFSLLCAGIQSENVCAEHLATMILNGVEENLKENVFQNLHKLFVNDPEHGTVYSSRTSLQLSILKYLASKKNFENYILYIESPFDSISNFIQQNINEYSFKSHVLSKLMNNLEIRIGEKLKELMGAVHNAIPMESITWQEWKLNYHTSISNLVRGVKLSDLDILDVYSVDNCTQFSDLLGQALKNSFSIFVWKDWLEKILASNTARACINITASITKVLIECKALCPFCREPCQLSAGEHEHYCGSFHRPQGISGWHYVTSEKISTEECDEDVLLNNKFTYNGVSYNYADYRTVNDNFNSWKILGEDYIESKYWQWVLCTFHNEFVDHYDVKRNAKIESKWALLSEEDVISDLEKHYQNCTFKNVN